MFRSFVIIVSSLLLSWAEAHAQPKKVRLLFAGSSSTYWNDMPREVAKVVDGKLSLFPDALVLPQIVGRSGSDIRVYAEPGFDRYEYGVKRGQSFLEKIREEKPEMVVLQVVCEFAMSDDPKPNGAGHLEAVTAYCDAIRKAGGEPVFYEMGWGIQERTAKGRERLFDLAVKNRIRFFVPCSSAWAQVYRERPTLELQHPKDKAHPGDLGHFLNLACFYATLTKQSPVGKLPRTYPVWPHGLAKLETEESKKTAADEVAKFTPDTYQKNMPTWMRRNMAKQVSATLDEATANYLETVAWEEYQRLSKKLLN